MINDTIKKPPVEELKIIKLSEVMKNSGVKKIKTPTEFTIDNNISFKKSQQVYKKFRKRKILR